MLPFEKDVGAILAKASKYGEAIHLEKAAGMIQFDMLQHKSQFNSTCLDGCLEDLSPHHCFNLYAWSNMEQISSHNSNMWHRNQTLQCHISYNTTALQSTRKGPQYIGIPRTHESPFAVYTGMHMFAKTNKEATRWYAAWEWAQYLLHQGPGNLSPAWRGSSCSVCGRWSSLSTSLEKEVVYNFSGWQHWP